MATTITRTSITASYLGTQPQLVIKTQVTKIVLKHVIRLIDIIGQKRDICFKTRQGAQSFMEWINHANIQRPFDDSLFDKECYHTISIIRRVESNFIQKNHFNKEVKI